MAQIPVSYTTDVNMSAAPRGLTARVVANVGLFSNEEASFSDEYRVYLDPKEVANDFGSESVTAIMANAMFSQSPNLTTGGGSLYIFPYVAKNATSCYLETGDISANVDNFKAVTDGTLKLTVDGKENSLKHLNFKAVKTVADVAAVIASKYADLAITVVEDKKIRFSSKQYGTASSVVVAAGDGDDDNDLTSANFLNVTAIQPVAGVNAVDKESLVDAFNRVAEKVYFGQIVDTCFRENDAVKKNAKALAATERNYWEVTQSLENIETLGNELLLGGYNRAKLVAYSMGATESKAMLAAYVSRLLATNYSGSQTCLTMNLKELATIDPDENMNLTYVNKAKANGVDVYCNQGGLGVTFSNKAAGGYADDMTGSQALVNDLQVAAYNYIRQVGTKVAQTEAGMTGVKSVVTKVFDQYVTNGFLGTGLTWNGATKFGDVEDFDRNIYQHGYYVYSLPVSQQAQAEREARIAPTIQAAGKSAGAIHFINISGFLEA